MAARLRWDGTAAATQGPSVRKEGGREVAHVKAAPFLFSLSLSLCGVIWKSKDSFYGRRPTRQRDRERERESDPAHRGGRHGGGVPFHLLLLAPLHK